MNGYILVDCTGVNLLAGEKQTVTGIFAKSTEAYNTDKPIIAFNMQYGQAGNNPYTLTITNNTGMTDRILFIYQ